MAWEEDQDEPGWDCFKIISDYEIMDSIVTEDSAKVIVKYKVLSTACDFELDKRSYLDSVEFELTKTKDAWKIKKYIPYPRVSIDNTLAFFKDLQKKLLTHDSGNKEELSKLRLFINELERLKKNHDK